MVVRSLFDLALAELCRGEPHQQLAHTPSECRASLLDYFSGHDQLRAAQPLLRSPGFARGLTQLTFYVCADLTDDMLAALTAENLNYRQITLVECAAITDEGVRRATRAQRRLHRLELRLMRQLTSAALDAVASVHLHHIDLSSCTKIASLRTLVQANPNIRSLFLNSCTALRDDALYDVAEFLSDTIMILQLDFLPYLEEPAAALWHLSTHCPHLRQLSLCRFFMEPDPPPALPIYGQQLNNANVNNNNNNMLNNNPIDGGDENEVDENDDPEHSPVLSIGGEDLQDVDLYGNYFQQIPNLPDSVAVLRLSFSGDEDPDVLLSSLSRLRELRDVHLQLNCRMASQISIDRANAFLCAVLPRLGRLVSILEIAVYWLFDETLQLICARLPRLSHLTLDVRRANSLLLARMFTGGHTSAGSRLVSLKLCRMQCSQRAVWAIARGAHSLTELEVPYVRAIDNRVLALLSDNCKKLRSVNLNGCHLVSDRGLIALARKCPLQEVRIRETACTDAALHALAAHCPDLQWVSHADYSGRPRFSERALQQLRAACVQRVLC